MVLKANLLSDLNSRVNSVSQGVVGDKLVIEAQSYLRIMGFPIGNYGTNKNGVDGHLGDATRASLSTFQILTENEVSVNVISSTIINQLELAAEANSTFRSLAAIAHQKEILLSISNLSSSAEFVNTIYYYSVLDETSSKVPSAVTTGQAILESGYGKSIPKDLVTNQFSYNLFGIKGTGPAGSVTSWTQEENKQTKIWETVRARFRAYHDYLESIKDHSQFFFDNINRYGIAFQKNTPAEFVKAIAKAGYATDSKYASKIITLMNFWGLS